MGKENDAMLSYLEDDARFADLFNQFYFGGEEVVKPQDLREASEVYTSFPYREGNAGGYRIRDIKRRLESGTWLKVLAVESQRDINYYMPWRIMDYDCKEYEKQIRRIQRRNHALETVGEREIYVNAGERLGRFRHSDRIAPVYTLCLYHGAEQWDGPRCLKDMVDFGEEESAEGRQKWESWFADYPMRLVCVNELSDCTGFRTSLGAVFAILFLRKDKEKLNALLEEEPVYQEMDEETAETLSVLMGVKKFMKRKEKYKEGEGYNMCQALREMMEDSRLEGWEEGMREGMRKRERKEKKAYKKAQAAGIRIFIQLNRDEGKREDDIVKNLQKYYDMSEQKARKLLKK